MARTNDGQPAGHLVFDAVQVTRAEADANAGWLVDGKVTALGADAIASALRTRPGSARLAGGTAACKIEPPKEIAP